MRSLLILIASFSLVPIAAAQQQPEPNLMPVPSSIKTGDGQLTIDRSFSVAVAGFEDASLKRGVQRFVAELSKQTGMLLKQKPGESTSPTLLVRATQPMHPELGGHVIAPELLERFRKEASQAETVEVPVNHYSVAAHPEARDRIASFLSGPR